MIKKKESVFKLVFLFFWKTPVMVLKILIHFYRKFVSPYLRPSCRYTPSCSAYALEALEKKGFFYGSYLTLNRLLRCHPWGGFGDDPLPLKKRNIKKNFYKKN